MWKMISLKELGIKIGEISIFAYKVQNKVLKASVFGGYTPREIENFMIKVYGSKKRTSEDVIYSCISSQPKAENNEESQL